MPLALPKCASGPCKASGLINVIPIDRAAASAAWRKFHFCPGGSVAAAGEAGDDKIGRRFYRRAPPLPPPAGRIFHLSPFVRPREAGAKRAEPSRAERAAVAARRSPLAFSVASASFVRVCPLASAPGQRSWSHANRRSSRRARRRAREAAAANLNDLMFLPRPPTACPGRRAAMSRRRREGARLLSGRARVAHRQPACCVIGGLRAHLSRAGGEFG